MEEIPSFREDVARIYRQMLLCQETEKIDKKMREEIIPEMLKNVSSMKICDSVLKKTMKKTMI